MKLTWKLTTDKGTFEGSTELQKGVNHVVVDLPACRIEDASSTLMMPMANSEKVFMNGYQTWTVCHEYQKNSRIRGLRGLPQRVVDQFALDRYGDYHFVNYRNRPGFLHGFSYCYFRKAGFFRLLASLDETNGYTIFRYNANDGGMTISRDCRGLKTEGSFHLLDLYYDEGSEESVFDGWFAAMQIKPRTTEKISGYSSWYNRYQDINAAAIRQDLSGCCRILEKNDLFQIDDGWEPFIGDWLEADSAKFPEGMKKMVDEIHGDGFRAGLWLAPFVAEEKSDVYRNHQDWFLKVNGDNWKAGSNWSGFYSLDIDHPEVREYLEKVFKRVFDEWGFDLVKLDFLYAAAPFGNENESRAGRRIRACKWLRELCGDKLILGCGVPVMPAFGLFDYCRISCDVSLDWDDRMYMRIIHRERVSTKNAVNNILTRRMLNGRAYLSDPDVFFLRSENIRLSEQEKEDLAKLDALLGGVFLTSDDPSRYTDEMISLYRKCRALTAAEDVTVSGSGLPVRVSYTMDGQRQSRSLFKRRSTRR